MIDGRYGLSGAQEIDVYLQAIRRAWDESHPSTPLVTVAGAADAELCDESCAPNRS